MAGEKQDGINNIDRKYRSFFISFDQQGFKKSDHVLYQDKNYQQVSGRGAEVFSIQKESR